MNHTIRLSLFISLLAFLSFQMTCQEIPVTGPDVVSKPCIDKSKIERKKVCTREFKPVCGCDGKTYSNVCTAEKNGVTSWNEGECPCIVEKLKRPDAPCTKELRPVCGCDKKTYNNECLARNAGLTKWTNGKCNELEETGCIDKTKISLRPCPTDYAPVCGCDNKTYSNICNAEINGVTKWTEGACCIDPTKISRRPCPDEFAPVCGCDGKTYSNECNAKNQGLTRWTPGKCTDDIKCIDKSKINPEKPCAKVFKPVCGCNGKTYGNECEAEKAGVTRWTPGKCNS